MCFIKFNIICDSVMYNLLFLIQTKCVPPSFFGAAMSAGVMERVALKDVCTSNDEEAIAAHRKSKFHRVLEDFV